MTFKDYFSGVAADYRDYRPRYPDPLFDYLATLSPGHELAWDCATGNGQVAVSLSAHYRKVVATDGSDAQITHASRVENIEYRTEAAEKSSLADGSIDLLTVGQALHWFDERAFESEVKRVLKPDAVLAVWSYAILESESAVDAVIHELYDGILGTYWTPERRMVEQGYRSVRFDLQELQVPAFAMTARWDFDHMLGYLATWSAAKRFEQQNGKHPLDLVSRQLADAWGDSDRVIDIQWPLNIRAWRQPGTA